MKARLLPGARPGVAMEEGTWYRVVWVALDGLWLDLGGEVPVVVGKIYLETVEDRAG